MSAHDGMVRRRAAAIERLGLLDRAGDPSLTALARVASFITGAESAAVHVLDETAQHRIAAVNAPLEAHPREDTLCRVVVDGDERIVCPDASRDPRMTHSSFVQGPDPALRFYVGVPLKAADGSTVGTLCAWDRRALELSAEQVERFADLAEQVVSRQELLRVAAELGHVASHDPLTGAVNRLVLADRLAGAFARRRRHGGEVLVIAADIDDFKRLNDTWGHAAGDKVLVTVARRLEEASRAEDTVARLGGDEFAVIAEVADGAGAAEIVRRLRTVLDKPVVLAGTPWQARVSLGAAFAEPGDDVPAALARADRRLYDDKPAG